jgi:hypothetical protein
MVATWPDDEHKCSLSSIQYTNTLRTGHSAYGCSAAYIIEEFFRQLVLSGVVHVGFWVLTPARRALPSAWQDVANGYDFPHKGDKAPLLSCTSQWKNESMTVSPST